MKSKKKSTKSKKNTAKLIINSNTYQLPIHKATEGNNVVDVTKLYSESGYFTYDPDLEIWLRFLFFLLSLNQSLIK